MRDVQRSVELQPDEARWRQGRKVVTIAKVLYVTTINVNPSSLRDLKVLKVAIFSGIINADQFHGLIAEKREVMVSRDGHQVIRLKGLDT